MKAEKFSESLNNINESYVEEAASYRAPARKAEEPKSFRSLKVWRIVAIAACACLAIGIGIVAIGASSTRMGSSGPARDESYYSEDGYSANGSKDSTSDEASPMEDGMAISGAAGAGGMEFDGGEIAAEPGVVDNSGIAKGTEGKNASFLENEDAKIIYTAYLNISTRDFDNTRAMIESVTNSHGGYFEDMELSGYSSSYRSAHYQIRIPAKELDNFLNDAEEFGSIISLNKSGEDISNEYYDTESRLKTAKTKLKRLQELLAQAEDMSDIITIEDAISNVEWEIDNYSGSMKYYDSHVEYSSVTLDLDEEYRTSEGDSFGDRLSSSFSGGLDGFKTAMQNLLIWLAESWIWILIVAVVIAAVIIIIVKTSRKNNKGHKKE